MKRPRTRAKTSGITPSPDDPASAAIAAEAAAQREEAWHADKEQTWNGKPLKAWSRERESLFFRITDQADEVTSGLESVPLIMARLAENKKVSMTIEQALDPHQFIEQAALVLYLASHEPEEWDNLRGRPAAFLRVANAWAEKGIPLGSEWPAIHKAVELRTAHRKLVAIRRPSPGSGGDSGN